jgi:hypothetical protein
MKPIIQPLAKWQRTLIFGLLLLAFIVSLPAFMFYATGYRYDFFAETPTITATGGMYIAAEGEEGLIYIDEELVDNARVFRSASYIQGLEPGLHRVHVQMAGRHTWVKELLVEPHMVTEVEAFNLPLWPQVRPVTKYLTVRGEAVVSATSSVAANITSKASSTIPFYLATTTATSTFRANAEYLLLEALFLEKAELKAMREAEKRANIQSDFTFATVTATSAKTVLATTTKQKNNLRLYQNEEEIYVATTGLGRDIPNYFCSVQIPAIDESTVMTVTEELLKENDDLLQVQDIGSRQCRSEIKIDRKGQEVIDFDFMPLNVNLVVLLLTDGVYVVEIDDRSWQNVQRLYSGENLEMVIYGDNIFIKEGDMILELLTEATIQ